METLFDLMTPINPEVAQCITTEAPIARKPRPKNAIDRQRRASDEFDTGFQAGLEHAMRAIRDYEPSTRLKLIVAEYKADLHGRLWSDLECGVKTLVLYRINAPDADDLDPTHAIK